MFKIITSYAFRNLIRTRLRSFFTLFSVALIIMLYTVLTSVGNAFTSQVSDALESQDVDVAVQARYAATPVSSIIDAKTVESIASMKEVNAVNTLLIGHKRIGGKASVVLLGVSNFTTFSQRLGFSVMDGRSLSDLDNEVVVGEKLAKVFGLRVGDELELDGVKKYRVVGIYSSWLNPLNSGVVTNINTLQTLVGKSDKASLLFLTLKDPTDADRVVEAINQQFPEMRAMESQQLPDYFGVIKSVFYFSKIVSVLTLFIAVAVLVNTFMMTISERVREVGILSAIGWPRSMIISVFLVESLLLSFLGGFLGYVSAYPVMAALQSNFTSATVYLPESPSISVFVNVLLMSFVIGVLSTVFPALYGTNIQVAKAVRHE